MILIYLKTKYLIKMITHKLVTTLFTKNLVKRNISSTILLKLTAKDIFFMSQLGMPNTDDFNFNSDLEYNSAIAKLKMGTCGTDTPIMYDCSTREVHLMEPDIFLASSIKNFVYQITTVKLFWIDAWTKQILGSPKENKPKRLLYAHYLQANLKKIDPLLFDKDLGYYWGSLIEDIELGLVGE